MSKAETKMLDDLANAEGVYRSDVIRRLVRRAHAERCGTQRTVPSKRVAK